jgi:adenylate cyclase
MPETRQIVVYDRQEVVHTGAFDGPIELGRQGREDETLFKRVPLAQGHRLVIAGRDEDSVSRKHARIEPVDAGRLRLRNLSEKVPIRLSDSREVKPGEALVIDMPACLFLGRRTVRIQEPEETSGDVERLPEATIAPGAAGFTPGDLATIGLSPGVGDRDLEALVRWLRGTMTTFQNAADADDFFLKAAQAVVEHVGLDSGRVIMFEGGDWVSRAVVAKPGIPLDNTWQASRHVLNRVRDERHTLWKSPPLTTTDAASLVGIALVLAAPILDRRGNVIGTLYGDRRLRGIATMTSAPRGSKLDAMLLELIATGLAGGLARLEMEKKAVQDRVQFEQFFTPELARVLAAQPEMLKGMDAEISVLFCDIRGFSRISHEMDPARVVEWISDVMGALSDCVRDNQGVLVDYIGDELMAMWGAPEERPDHARLACRAAMAMLDLVPELNERWAAGLGEAMDLGIGINTGRARVGNIGTRHKFKYGPLGNTVNLASRVQGVTKYLKARLLVTGATHALLGPEFAARRFGLVRMVNIAEPADLYELTPPDHPNWGDLRRGYELALAEFERGEFRRSAQLLGNLLLDHPDDGPSLVLMSRVVACLIEPGSFDPVFVPPGK